MGRRWDRKNRVNNDQRACQIPLVLLRCRERVCTSRVNSTPRCYSTINTRARASSCTRHSFGTRVENRVLSALDAAFREQPAQNRRSCEQQFGDGRATGDYVFIYKIPTKKKCTTLNASRRTGSRTGPRRLIRYNYYF